MFLGGQEVLEDSIVGDHRRVPEGATRDPVVLSADEDEVTVVHDPIRLSKNPTGSTSKDCPRIRNHFFYFSFFALENLLRTEPMLSTIILFFDRLTKAWSLGLVFLSLSPASLLTYPSLS